MRRIAVLLIVIGLAAVACSSGDESGGAMSVEEPIGAPNDGRVSASVLKNAAIDIEVVESKLTGAAQKVVDVVTSNHIGGFMVSSLIDLEGEHGFGKVVAKVPAPNFEEAVTNLGAIGEVTRQELRGQDLTEDFLATSARINVVEGRIANLLSRLSGTEDSGVRFQLRQDLATAREDLRRLENDQTYIEGQTSYSTIDVALTGVVPPAPAEKPVFERALGTAKSIVVAIASGLVLAAGVIVPIGLVAFVVYLVGAPVVRRFRARPGELTG